MTDQDIRDSLVARLAERPTWTDCEVLVEPFGNGVAVWFISDGFDGMNEQIRAVEAFKFVVSVLGTASSQRVYSCTGLTRSDRARLEETAKLEKPVWA